MLPIIPFSRDIAYINQKEDSRADSYMPTEQAGVLNHNFRNE